MSNVVNFEPGSGFLICGFVVRKWVSPAGKFASLVLDVPGERGSSKIDLRCFSDGPIAEIGNLQGGMKVHVTGSVDMEVLRSKEIDTVTGKKKDVIVDGFKRWIPCLTIRKMDVEPSSVAPVDDKLSW